LGPRSSSLRTCKLDFLIDLYFLLTSFSHVLANFQQTLSFNKKEKILYCAPPLEDLKPLALGDEHTYHVSYV
jgi:hypothetical protein